LKDKKILFVIPDGIGIRNYLYTDLLIHLHHSGFKILLMHKLDQELIEMVNKRLNVPIHQIEFKSFPETKKQTFLREATVYARLKENAKRNVNPTILINWRRGPLGRGKKYFLCAAKFFGKNIGNYKWIREIESAIQKQWDDSDAFSHYQLLLEEHHPDLVFITHQRVPELVPICRAASAQQIPTISAIFSWDNLPKAKLPIRTDYYTVWSDYMKSELLDYYPEISADQIFITGTPQFDFYDQKSLLYSREEFAKKYHLDSSKKWVLFSGDDELTSPHDPEYLKDVAEALKEQKDIQVLFRQVPVTGPERYSHVLNKYPNVFHIPPLWQKGQSWISFFPLFDDIQLLMNLCYHCHTVVNIGSTMALDFAFFDKPGIFLKYDTVNDPNWTTDVIYQFQHFRTMKGLDAVLLVLSREDILKKINFALNSPQTVAVDRKKWKDMVVKTGKSASIELSNLFISLVPSTKTSRDA
jgi:hypothetical protein